MLFISLASNVLERYGHLKASNFKYLVQDPKNRASVPWTCSEQFGCSVPRPVPF